MPLRRSEPRKIQRSMRSWMRLLWWCRATKVFPVDGPCTPTLGDNLSEEFLPTPEIDCKLLQLLLMNIFSGGRTVQVNISIKMFIMGNPGTFYATTISCNECLFSAISGVVVMPDGDVFSPITGKIAEPTFFIAEIAIVAVTCSHFQIANRTMPKCSDHPQSSLRKRKSLANHPGQNIHRKFFLRMLEVCKNYFDYDD